MSCPCFSKSVDGPEDARRQRKQDSSTLSKSDTRASESISEVDLANWQAVADLVVNRICRKHGESARQQLQEVLNKVHIKQADNEPMMWKSSQVSEAEDSRYDGATSIEARMSRDGTKVILVQRQREVAKEYRPTPLSSGRSRSPDGNQGNMENDARLASAMDDQASPPLEVQRGKGLHEEAADSSPAGFYSTQPPASSSEDSEEVHARFSEGFNGLNRFYASRSRTRP